MRDVDDLHRDLRRRYWHPDNDGIPLPAKPAPYRPRKDWRTRLDARISRCPGCDGLQWDGACRRCIGAGQSGSGNMAVLTQDGPRGAGNTVARGPNPARRG